MSAGHGSFRFPGDPLPPRAHRARLIDTLDETWRIDVLSRSAGARGREELRLHMDVSADTYVVATTVGSGGRGRVAFAKVDMSSVSSSHFDLARLVDRAVLQAAHEALAALRSAPEREAMPETTAADYLLGVIA